MGQTGYFYVCSVAVLLLVGRFGNESKAKSLESAGGTFTSSGTVWEWFKLDKNKNAPWHFYF